MTIVNEFPDTEEESRSLVAVMSNLRGKGLTLLDSSRYRASWWGVMVVLYHHHLARVSFVSVRVPIYYISSQKPAKGSPCKETFLSNISGLLCVWGVGGGG